MAAVEHVLSSAEIKNHVANMAAIVRNRKESPAKVTKQSEIRVVT
jgi:hypothetical protein